jgi:hypothetical protein
LGGWNLYRYYSAKKCSKMKLMTIVLQKKTLIYQLVFGFLYSDRVNYVMGLIMSIDPHWFSTLLDGTFYQVSL